MTRSIKTLLSTLESVGTHPIKSFGQNFLIDSNIVRKIISCGQVSKNDTVLEIGPGEGSLTRALLETGARVIAVEKDKKLHAYLKNTFTSVEGFSVLRNDVLETDFSEILPSGIPIKIVSNIPYNISSQILIKIVKSSDLFPDVFLSMQKEVAERITAREGSKIYGLLTPFIKTVFQSKILFLISPNCFHPRPKVWTAFVHMKRYRSAAEAEKKEYFYFLKTCFSQRRKKMSSLLKKNYPENLIKEIYQEIPINENARAESLSPETLHRVFTLLSSK
jgi:16S rRNA (adenine1518-N6/adenine1519-N6)-dimethyltransferase